MALRKKSPVELVLDSLRSGLQNAVKKLLGNDIVDEAAIKEFVRDLQRALIQADVNVKLVLSVTESVQRRALEEKPPPGLDRKNQIVKILYEELDRLLGGDQELKLDRTKPTVIVMLGIQGSGKTTTVGKLARFYAKKGFKVGVVAADTFRPGAVTQLKTIAQVVGVDVYSDEKEKDSVKVAEAGKRFFEEGGKNLIIIDTAGRHKEEQSLLDEMSRIYSKVKPDLNLLVVDGTIGQQSFNQAAAFHKASPVGGIVVTKLDGAAKGGGALAAVGATGAKVFFIGTGERVDDLEEFSATRFVGRLLGMGDLKALLDMAKQVEGEVDEKRVQRMVTGQAHDGRLPLPVRAGQQDGLAEEDPRPDTRRLREHEERGPGEGREEHEDLEEHHPGDDRRGEGGAREAERPEGEADRQGVGQEREGREGADREVQADQEHDEVGQGPGDEAVPQESRRSSPGWMRSS